MRRWAIGLLLGCWGTGIGYGQPTPTPSGSPAAAPGTGVQVLHAADLAQAGAVRLSDLFALLDDWYALSIEGFAWRAAPNGLAPTHQARWQLYVDGHRLDLTVFDEQNLNLAPVHVSQLDSVVVHDLPTVIGGRLAEAGVVHLYTHRPSGLEARVGIMGGNEIDDPGPYSFTDQATRNVDRIGPGYVADLGYGSRTTSIEATYTQDVHYVTKRPQWDRVFGIYGRPHDQNRIVLQTAGVAAHTQTRYSTHRVLAGYTRFRDYRFLDPLGFDVTTERTTPHASLAGTLALTPAATLSYKAGFVQSKLGEWANRVDHNFAWTQHRLRGHLAFTHRRNGLRLTTGLSSDLHTSHTSTTPGFDKATIYTGQLYQQVGFRPAPFWYQELTGFVTQTENAYGVEGLAISSLHLAPRHTLALTASYLSRPSADVNSLWYWLLQGYTFPWQDRTDLSLPTTLSRRRTATLDAAWQLTLLPQVTVRARGGVRWFQGLVDADHTFGYVHPDQIFQNHVPGTAHVRTNLSGRVLRGSITVWHRPGPGFQQRLHYTYQTASENDSTFAQAWQRQPAHTLHYTVGYAPFPRFSVHGRLRVQSTTTWPGYVRADRATDGLYRAHLPPLALVDLAVRKPFWHDHLDVTLSLRNVLNAPYRTHPAAPESRLTFFFQVVARL